MNEYNKDSWQQFTQTGKVMDYLSYKQQSMKGIQNNYGGSISYGNNYTGGSDKATQYR